MKEKKKFSARMEKFLAGKGFYIVLFVCVAVVGVSAWVLLFSDYALSDGDGEDYAPVMANVDDQAIINDTQETSVPDIEMQEPVPVKDEPAVEMETEPSEQVSAPAEAPEEAKAPEESEEDNSEKTSIADITFIWPISGDIAVEYSPATLIFSKTMSDWRTHDGVDIAAQIGAKVMSVADGTVLEVREDDLLGTTVMIEHGDGLTSQYSNLASAPTVAEGDAVTMGSVIGSVGDTALGETGDVAHLHFALKLEGEPVDPADYLPKK